MSGFYAILHKELYNFFASPIAYLVVGCFLFLAGIFFWVNLSVLSVYSLQASAAPGAANFLNMTDMVVRPLFQNLSVLILFLAPLLTMRLLAEEKRSGCIELLLTYPIADSAIVVGKFLAAAAVVLLMLVGTLPCMIMLFGLGNPEMGPIITGYSGLLLMGLAIVSVGTFVSSLTENQIISAAISFVAALAFWAMSWAQAFVDKSVGYVVQQVSILAHMEPFEKGIVSLSDISFFVLFTAFFLFLTLRSVETQRWKG